jgi:hypothetical protein
MDMARFVEEIAATHGCAPSVVQAVMTAAHEQIGGLAAWHLMGLLVDAADSGNPGALVQAYVKVEASPAQYDAIWARWDDEKTRGK